MRAQPGSGDLHEAAMKMADQARRALSNDDHLVAAAYFTAAAEMERQVLALVPSSKERTRLVTADSMANLIAAASDARRQAVRSAEQVRESR